jgi:hypothetical protein
LLSDNFGILILGGPGCTKWRTKASQNTPRSRSKLRLAGESSKETSNEDEENTSWDGSMNHTEKTAETLTSDSEDSEDELVELDGDKLLKAVEAKEVADILTVQSDVLDGPSKIMSCTKEMSNRDWKSIEANQRLGYNGLSERKAHLD